MFKKIILILITCTIANAKLLNFGNISIENQTPYTVILLPLQKQTPSIIQTTIKPHEYGLLRINTNDIQEIFLNYYDSTNIKAKMPKKILSKIIQIIKLGEVPILKISTKENIPVYTIFSIKEAALSA
jgi:hypothetical protein